MTTNPERPANRRPPLLGALSERYPVFKDAKPLAIGIHKTLLLEQPELDKNDVRTAMKSHTHSTRYLKGIVEGAPRFDLAGNAEGTVTAEQQAQAVAVLKERIKKANERRKAEEVARKAEETARKAEEEAQKRLAKLQQLADKFKTH